MDIIIVGAGGFGREVRQVYGGLFESRGLRFKGFLGRDHGAAEDESIRDCVLDDPETYVPEKGDRFVLAIGNMSARARIVEVLLGKGAEFLTFVHPQAFVAPTARLGTGVLIYPMSVVSHEAVLDDFVNLNFLTCVGHNARLGKYCLLAPYATVNGFASLEESVYMSTHSTVGPQVQVGARSVISANSAITRDSPPDSFIFGVPGRVTTKAELG
jgi:sugar O-acyltransferase (sialic acid O-acetyltransferase NeuD family)